jgi:hypothetical protein
MSAIAAEAKEQLIVEQLLAELSKIGMPATQAIARGSVQGKSAGDLELTVALAGGTLLAAIARQKTIAISSVKWGGTDMILVPGSATDFDTGRLEVYALHNLPAQTDDITVLFASGATAVLLATEIRNMVADPVDVVHPNTSSGNAPTTGLTAMRQAGPELLYAVVATEGPLGDQAGTWDTPFVGLQRDGTSGGSPTTNYTLSDAWWLANESGTEGASKDNIASRVWAATLISLKPEWLTSPQPPVDDSPNDALGPSDYQQFVEHVVTRSNDTERDVRGHMQTMVLWIHSIVLDRDKGMRKLRRLDSDQFRAIQAAENTLIAVCGYGMRIGDFTPNVEMAAAGFRRGVRVLEFDYNHEDTAH